MTISPEAELQAAVERLREHILWLQASGTEYLDTAADAIATVLSALTPKPAPDMAEFEKLLKSYSMADGSVGMMADRLSELNKFSDADLNKKERAEKIELNRNLPKEREELARRQTAILTAISTALAQRDARIADLEAGLNMLIESADLAYHHGDFRNGVTDSTGSIDEGDVRIAGPLGDAIRNARSLLANTSAEPGVKS